MSTKICLLANTFNYLEGGGHFWVYLNWAMGFRSLGCEVVWMEPVYPGDEIRDVQVRIAKLKSYLARYDFGDSVAIPWEQELPNEKCLVLEQAIDADLLLNLVPQVDSDLVGRFRCSALIDIDPGLTQAAITKSQLNVAKHDYYFTIGETVGQKGALIPDCGLRWFYTPPPVSLDFWTQAKAESTRPYTTITHWWEEPLQFQGEIVPNGKCETFRCFVSLPPLVSAKLEIACSYMEDDESLFREHGWSIRDAHEVSSTPWLYQEYIQNSRGEFSCAKPSCMKFQNAWISDRTLCYLASAKPAIVQHTGFSRFLPEAAGLFRFRSLEEATSAFATVESNYGYHCQLARDLAKEYFDATKVAKRVLETALS